MQHFTVFLHSRYATFNISTWFLFITLLLQTVGFSQTPVTGIIRNCDTGDPVSGANILVQETGIGAVSEGDGTFLLDVPEGVKSRLQISFVGYQGLIQPVSAKQVTDTIHLILCMKPEIQQMPEIFITATRTPQKPSQIPARIATILGSEVLEMPISNTDEALQVVPGINFDRDFGIFSKNSSVTMRGLNGSYRTLILMDGVPLNKTDGGGINWNRLIPGYIERIEVLKGPVSAVYGSNAMSGVVNVITRKPIARFEGEIKAFTGTFRTFGGFIKVGGSLIKRDRGFYYNATGFYRKGKGYIVEPEATRDSFDTNTYLKEGTLAGKLGYQFNQRNKVELEYNYYNDIRGAGTKIYEPLGSYNRYPTHFVRLSTQNGWGKYSLLVNGFFQHENYIRQNESISNKSGKYTLYKTDSKRNDYGLWLNLTNQIRKNQAITVGMDLKQGNVNATTTYLTSSDILNNKGKMSFFALFAEYQLSILQKKMAITGGLRWDIAWFTNGSFTIEDPSKLTQFMTNFPTEFSDETWNAISPKLGLQYNFNSLQSLYLSYAHGFRPPILDDMCKNGNISKGFKLANPQLKPESIDNFEAGSTVMFFKKIRLEPSLYLSLGRDFQYFVATGDSVNTGGNNLKPVMKRENISRVRVLGAEITMNIPLVKTLDLIANYAYNDSRITQFDTSLFTGEDLTGKFLMEVPPHQAFAGLVFTPWWLTASITFRFVGKQWIDDANTVQTPDYFTIDMKASHTFFNHLTLGLTVQNLLNRQWVNNKGQLSPGRFIMLNLSFRFLR